MSQKNNHVMFHSKFIVGVFGQVFKIGEGFHKEKCGQSSNMRKGIMMFMGFILITLTSCVNNQENSGAINQLDLRITRLEKKVDSLINSQHTSSIGSNNTHSNNPVIYGTVRQTNRCQAITKKRTQCKRTAKSGDYCWQHGG